MGANAVRLVHTDHRRIGELVRRLSRPYRAGAELRAQAAAELIAHAAVTREVLLPFLADRLDPPPADEHERVLDELGELARRLTECGDPPPPVLVGDLTATWARHEELEAPPMAALEQVVEVPRLRVLGEALRRRRDAALRSERRGTSALRRPAASRAELYERARRLEVVGRSSMSRAELEEALTRRMRS